MLSLYARPSLLLTNNRLGAVPEMWSCLGEQCQDVEMVQRGVGRLELMGHPEWDWAGTAFLINETTLMTTRRTAEIFCEMQGQNWTFRPGITAWMDYGCEPQRQASAGCKVRGVIGVHDRYDLALLEVEPSPEACPLVLSSISPMEMRGRPVYMVSFPVCDARRSEPETDHPHLPRRLWLQTRQSGPDRQQLPLRQRRTDEPRLLHARAKRPAAASSTCRPTRSSACR